MVSAIAGTRRIEPKPDLHNAGTEFGAELFVTSFRAVDADDAVYSGIASMAKRRLIMPIRIQKPVDKREFGRRSPPDLMVSFSFFDTGNPVLLWGWEILK